MYIFSQSLYTLVYTLRNNDSICDCRFASLRSFWSVTRYAVDGTLKITRTNFSCMRFASEIALLFIILVGDYHYSRSAVLHLSKNGSFFKYFLLHSLLCLQFFSVQFAFACLQTCISINCRHFCTVAMSVIASRKAV